MILIIFYLFFIHHTYTKSYKDINKGKIDKKRFKNLELSWLHKRQYSTLPKIKKIKK